ncbi:MAG: helix-turn-helix domain-containing protein [Pseudomonadales bacterium]
MKLGDKLRTHREKRQWTQPKAAEVIGIEQSYLSKLENDHSIPSLEVFRRIVDAYETDVGELMDGIDPKDFAHLVQITDVADYLNAERRARGARRRRRTTLQSFAVAIGACLIYAGLADLFFPFANSLGQAWRNQAVTFVGIFALTYGLIGLLVASARQQARGD